MNCDDVVQDESPTAVSLATALKSSLAEVKFYYRVGIIT